MYIIITRSVINHNLQQKKYRLKDNKEDNKKWKWRTHDTTHESLKGQWIQHSLQCNNNNNMTGELRVEHFNLGSLLKQYYYVYITILLFSLTKPQLALLLTFTIVHIDHYCLRLIFTIITTLLVTCSSSKSNQRINQLLVVGD